MWRGTSWEAYWDTGTAGPDHTAAAAVGSVLSWQQPRDLSNTLTKAS